MTEANKTPETETPKTAPKKVKTAYIRAVHGSMTHLYTNKVFGVDPVKVEIDGFVQAQLDAGKLEIVTD